MTTEELAAVEAEVAAEEALAELNPDLTPEELEIVMATLTEQEIETLAAVSKFSAADLDKFK